MFGLPVGVRTRSQETRPFTLEMRGYDHVFFSSFLLCLFMLVKYYNKEYREGFPRGFLLIAAVVCPQTRRVGGQSTAKVNKIPEGLS